MDNASSHMWRAIVDGMAGAFPNMAVDEAILMQCIEGESAPTLRFYEWEKPSISIGYAMNPETEVDLSLCRERDVPVVRRITGGGLVLHKCDITYTVIFPEDFGLGDQGTGNRLSVLESYRLVNRALAKGVKELGIVTSLLSRDEETAHSRQKTANICFSNPTVYDILYQGKKLAGSAQRRKRGWVLHQGSMLFSADFVTMCRLARSDDSMAETAVCLEGILGKRPDPHNVVNVLSKNFTGALGIQLDPGDLSESEREMAQRLEKEKYSTDEWNLERRVRTSV